MPFALCDPIDRLDAELAVMARSVTEKARMALDPLQ